MDETGNPLTLEHLNQINNALEQIKTGLKAVELAKRANIDVADQERKLNETQSQLRQIKSVYFPGQP